VKTWDPFDAARDRKPEAINQFTQAPSANQTSDNVLK
jgi:hypothetical protein